MKSKYFMMFPKNFLGSRMFFLWFLVFLLMCVLILRITYLQLVIPNQLVHEGDMRSLRMKQVSIIRGMIMDRDRRLLAVSVPVYAIWADPKKIMQYNNIDNIMSNDNWKLLSEALSISLDKLYVRIYDNRKLRFIYLARQVSLSIGNDIIELKLPGIYLQQESRRYYPSGPAVAHVVGVTNIDGQGLEGIEKSFNTCLTGKPGERIVRKDRFGRVIENISFIDGQDSHNIILSIDERLQTLVYRELNNAVIINKAESGSAVLLNVNTGEVLAMVNSPSYNPNNLSTATIFSMRNRAITDVFEPGSTIKPMVIIAALDHGIINKNTIVNTIPYTLNGHLIKDVGFYNKLTISEILQKSSNVGISKIALSMPTSMLLDAYCRFGIGKQTNLGLVGECCGVYPNNKQRWSDIEIAALSYGYGFMVTPLQLARAYATIGSIGILRPLSILRVDHDIPVTGKRVFSEDSVRNVIRMMENVAAPGNSGAKAAIKGYRVAVKTGTVKKVGNNGKYVNRYIAYTAGIAPASSPRFALVIIINEPHNDIDNQYYGGIVSAPVFSNIMSNVLRMMNIEPDAFL